MALRAIDVVLQRLGQMGVDDALHVFEVEGSQVCRDQQVGLTVAKGLQKAPAGSARRTRMVPDRYCTPPETLTKPPAEVNWKAAVDESPRSSVKLSVQV